MRRDQQSILLLLAIVTRGFLGSAALLAADAPLRETQLFDFDWHFFLGNPPEAQAPTFADSGWRALDLPHDWSIEDLAPPAAGAPGTRIVSGPFDSAAPGGSNTGFTVGGTGWYRKHFTVPGTWRGKVITVRFDGVYANASVWLNGHLLGEQPYGFSTFSFDLSPYLRYEAGANVLAVQVRNEGLNSRWYAGSGIYRHVWLSITPPLRIAPWNPVITTPRAEPAGATVRVQTTLLGAVADGAGLVLRVALRDAAGTKVAGGEAPAKPGAANAPAFDQTFEIAHPQLWSPDTPSLYHATCELVADGQVVDREESPFGIRSLRFDPERGFILNGQPVRLRGGCIHDNNGALGAAAFDRAEERKVALVKAAGFNALRSAHNPRSPAFLAACDRLGMMVIEEAFDLWHAAKNPDDYHLYFDAWWQRDLGMMIERGRNHPAIILWSLSNMTPESATPDGARTARQVATFVRALDPTRPVTANVYRFGERTDHDPYFAALDVGGYSYGRRFYESDHQRLPQRIILATETSQRDMFDYWMQVVDHAYVAGDFCWTAMDYMGESSNGWLGFGYTPAQVFPWTLAYCGDLDLSGERRPQSYYREVLWDHGSRLAAFVHRPVPSLPGNNKSRWGWDDVAANWTWPGHEGKALQVDVYSRWDEVRLLLDGKDLGAKATTREGKFIASWSVPYEPGVLTAVGYRQQQEVARCELRTAGQPVALRLRADRARIAADGQDLCYVTAEVVDAQGQRVPDAQTLVHFTCSGAGMLAAVGNAKPNSLESFRQPRRTTFEGRCLAIIRAARSPGAVRLTAHADGLAGGTLEIQVSAGLAVPDTTSRP